MRTYIRERKAEATAQKNKKAGEKNVLAAIAKMPQPDRGLAKKIHTLVTKNAPKLWPKTWYGMPAYTTKEGKVVCFFQNASKFKYRYSTLGFQDGANLDDGNVWPVAFAVDTLTPADENKIAALIKKAIR